MSKDWVFHNKPYEYMERDGWMKAMMHFKTVFGANNLNPKVLFYDGQYRHFDERYIHILHYNHIKPFVLNASDPGKHPSNDNGPNIKLEGIYGQDRMN